MYNWSTDITKIKINPQKYALWKLVQQINYGLDGEKLDRTVVKQKWTEIEDRLDPYKRRTLEYLLWEKLYSLPDNLNFWSVSR